MVKIKTKIVSSRIKFSTYLKLQVVAKEKVWSISTLIEEVLEAYIKNNQH
jgi:hypothetical protein